MKDVQTIEEIFSGRIFQITDYQRGYAWEKRQWDDFLEDLDLCLKPERNTTPVRWCCMRLMVSGP